MLRIDGRSAAKDTRNISGAREYRKTATTRAVQMQEAFEVETEEGVMQGKAGDYLCIGPLGEAWPVRQDIFEITYEPV